MMSDIFISYKKEDAASASALIQRLKLEGFSVWWDMDIPPNAPWEQTIEQHLHDCKTAVVLWSELSVQSENVKAEARWARKHHKLFQAFLGSGPINGIPDQPGL